MLFLKHGNCIYFSNEFPFHEKLLESRVSSMFGLKYKNRSLSIKPSILYLFKPSPTDGEECLVHQDCDGDNLRCVNQRCTDAAAQTAKSLQDVAIQTSQSLEKPHVEGSPAKAPPAPTTRDAETNTDTAAATKRVQISTKRAAKECERCRKCTVPGTWRFGVLCLFLHSSTFHFCSWRSVRGGGRRMPRGALHGVSDGPVPLPGRVLPQGGPLHGRAGRVCARRPVLRAGHGVQQQTVYLPQRSVLR